jgi:hypothetical protein
MAMATFFRNGFMAPPLNNIKFSAISQKVKVPGMIAVDILEMRVS